MNYVKVDAQNRDETIAKAAATLLRGGVVVFPTDTVYGIAAHPDFPEAIERIYEIKGRAENKPIALLASKVDAPKNLGAVMPPVAETLAKRFWPGALTLVLDCGDKTEGFRIPDLHLACDIIEACGGLLRVTSANLSGESAQDNLSEELNPILEKSDLVIDGGKCPGGEPSAVVKVTKDGIVTILRDGLGGELKKIRL